MHARQQIRQAVTAALTGLTTTGANVFASRVYQMTANELPGLIIYTGDDSNPENVIDVTLTDEAQKTRELAIIIEGYSAASSNLDNTLDAIAEEVETVMDSHNFSAVLKWLQLQSTTIAMRGDADQPTGVVRLEYRAIYRTQDGAPGAII